MIQINTRLDMGYPDFMGWLFKRFIDIKILIWKVDCHDYNYQYIRQLYTTDI